MVRHWSILIISFRVTSLALGQSYDCPRASEVIPTSIDNRITWINRELIIWPQQSKAKQNHVHTETWELSLCQLYHHWWHRLLCHQWWQSWHYDLSQIPVHILWARLYPVIPLAHQLVSWAHLYSDMAIWCSGELEFDHHRWLKYWNTQDTHWKTGTVIILAWKYTLKIL